MASYITEYERFMDSQGIKYSHQNATSVSISYETSNIKSCRVQVNFDADGDNKVAFHSWSIGNVKDDEKFSKALVLCNELNKQYRWVKFYIDDDRDIAVSADAIVDLSSVGSECAEMVSRMVNISDAAYPQFMKLLWF